MLQNCRQQSMKIYHKYIRPDSFWGIREIIWNALFSFLVVLFFSWFFYRTLIAIPILSPLGFLFFCKKKDIDKRNFQQVLRGQFKDLINAIAANLKTGYALENAIRECYVEMELLYGKKAYINDGLRHLIRGLDHNIAVEKLMRNFAKETELEEITQFADILGIAKRSGGNMSEIITDTSKLIGDKIELQKELHVMTAAKVLELNIMNIIPIGIVMYIELTSPGYFDVLYGTSLGITIMTICLIVYVTVHFWGNKIIQIPI